MKQKILLGGIAAGATGAIVAAALTGTVAGSDPSWILTALGAALCSAAGWPLAKRKLF